MFDLEDGLPEDMEGRDALIAKFNGEDSVEKLARGYMELEKLRGRSVALPSEASSDDEWDRVMQRLGRPSDERGYTFPDGVDSGKYESFAKVAMAARMTQRQFDRFIEEMQSADQVRAVEEAESISDSREQIAAQYGRGLDSAMARASRAAKANGVSDGWEDNPEMFRLLERMGSQMTSGQAPSGTEGVPPAGNPKKVAAQLRDVMTSAAYNDSFHAEHESAMMLADQLREQLHELGYNSVLDPELLGEYSPLRGAVGPRPWDSM